MRKAGHDILCRAACVCVYEQVFKWEFQKEEKVMENPLNWKLIFT